MEFELITKTFMGPEPVLVQRPTQLGANNMQVGRGVVSLTGDQEMAYRANFQFHTAIRVLKPIKHFEARPAKEIHDEIKMADWSQCIKKRKAFSVDSMVYSEKLRSSRFVTYKVRDVVVDQFREKTGTHPSISMSNPDIRLHIHTTEEDTTLRLGSSGESLHRRGYRQESVKAPLNKVLVAGIALMTDWKGGTDFIDPMYGSDTLLIETTLVARNMSPGISRKEFAFEKWSDFGQELPDRIYSDESQESGFTHHIYDCDTDMKAVNTTRLNVKVAGLTKDITIGQADFKNSKKPQKPSILITNPPYGERTFAPNLLGAYKMIGERLKHEFMGNSAWILSYHEECSEQIDLKPSTKIPVYSGGLGCELRKYAIFDGKTKELHTEGDIIKTRAEKKEMAEKYRFEESHELKKHLEENEESEVADIRSSEFHSLERVQERDEQKKGGSHRNDRLYDGNDRSSYKGKERFDKDERGRSSDKRGDKEHGGKNYQVDNYE